MRRVALALFLTLALGTLASVSFSAERLDYAYFLRQLTDLENLPRLQTGVTCKQFSSFDRASLDPAHWDANGDAGQYISVDPATGEALMADMQGPGCIFRIWSANPQGKIRFYLDGDTKPTFEWDFNSIFTGEVDPFLPPLVWKRGGVQSGSDCYLPVPYAKSCRVTADKRYGQYYHIGYKTYAAGTEVKTFHLPLTAEERQALEAARTLWNNRGADPTPKGADRVVTKDAALKPGERVAITPRDLPGPAMIHAVRVKVEGGERYAWQKTVLSGYWDGETDPSVHAPLAAFFGTGWYPNAYRSFPLGIVDGQGYCYFAMPFRKSARFELANMGRLPVTIHAEIAYLPGYKVADDLAYFHARWRREAPAVPFDWPFLEATGQGHFVGVTLSVDYPNPHWWGEGDEKVWVDGESFPSTFGTGSEDYFGDAWGIQPADQPCFCCNYLQGTRVCCYRWHLADSIPFSKSYKMTIENYPDFPEDYACCTFWYQTEPHRTYFPTITPEMLRTWGKSLPWTTEIEDLFAEIPGGVRIDDANLPREFSHETAVRLTAAAGKKLTGGKFKVNGDDVFFLTLWGLASESNPPVKLLVDGNPLPARPRTVGADDKADFGGVELKAGEHRLDLEFAGAGETVLDCLQVNPSPHVEGAIEAESLTPKDASGRATAIEVATLPWSGGRALNFPAEKAGDALTLDLPGKAQDEFTLVARFTNGPDCGDVQAYQDGKPLGQPVSTYAPDLKLGPDVALGNVKLTDQNRTIRLQVTGKAEASKGYRISLDYFMLRRIIVKGAIEGETSKVLDSKGAGTTVQALGWGDEQWNGGAQLWLPNTRDPEGFMTIEAEVPQDGKYRLAVYLTTARDYAICQVLMDGQKVGEPIDCYTPDVRWRGKVDLGLVELKAGAHQLRFQSSGKNPQSVGYMIGLDCYTLEPAG